VARDFRSPLVDSATMRQPAKRSLELALFRRGFRDRLGKPKSTTKMPRSVKRAITAVEDAKMVDQRAETGERRGAQFNRIADLRCVVFYSLRAAPGSNVKCPISTTNRRLSRPQE
jgi:hypothetical protein